MIVQTTAVLEPIARDVGVWFKDYRHTDHNRYRFTLDLSESAQCSECDGRGWFADAVPGLNPSGRWTCPDCKGKGTTGKKYQRLGFSRTSNGNRRRIHSVCWHGYRDFMAAVYAVDPDAVFRTALATYRNRAEFERTFPATGDKQVGSMADPVRYRDLCTCQED